MMKLKFSKIAFPSELKFKTNKTGFKAAIYFGHIKVVLHKFSFLFGGPKYTVTRMKLFWLLIVSTSLGLMSCASPKENVSFNFLMVYKTTKCLYWNIKVHKFTKAECSSTGLTCPNVYCKVKAVSRTTSLMNYGCNLKRNLTFFRVTIFLSE